MKSMKAWWVSLLFALLASTAHALPSVAGVEAEVQKGHYTQAESMMREVVAAKPDSARAHYVLAEILAHNARFAEAAEHAAQAKRLDPSLKFTNPDSFNAFEQQLQREQQRAARARSGGASSLDRLGPSSLAAPAAESPQQMALQRAGGVPAWIWVAGLAVFAWLVWRLMRSNPAAAPYRAPGYAPGPSYAPAPAYGPGPSYAPGAGVPSAGSGLMGVGLAAAGGVAAGMLAERLLEGNHASPRSDGFFDRDTYAAPPVDEDARALEDRNIDFGSGNDWDDGGGSVDLGGGGGSDDGGW